MNVFRSHVYDRYCMPNFIATKLKKILETKTSVFLRHSVQGAHQASLTGLYARSRG